MELLDLFERSKDRIPLVTDHSRCCRMIHLTIIYSHNMFHVAYKFFFRLNQFLNCGPETLKKFSVQLSFIKKSK